MQELKDAEELVNEYRQHPPKIGWRTVFVQFSQYTRLDVGARKPDSQVTYTDIDVEGSRQKGPIWSGNVL